MLGAVEMTKWLGALVVILDNWSLVPSTCVEQLITACNSSSRLPSTLYDLSGHSRAHRHANKNKKSFSKIRNLMLKLLNLGNGLFHFYFCLNVNIALKYVSMSSWQHWQAEKHTLLIHLQYPLPLSLPDLLYRAQKHIVQLFMLRQRALFNILAIMQ